MAGYPGEEAPRVMDIVADVTDEDPNYARGSHLNLTGSVNALATKQAHGADLHPLGSRPRSRAVNLLVSRSVTRFSYFLHRRVAQPVDENLDEPQHALLPTRLVVHVAHGS
jgi:hypothetical protein